MIPWRIILTRMVGKHAMIPWLVKSDNIRLRDARYFLLLFVAVLTRNGIVMDANKSRMKTRKRNNGIAKVVSIKDRNNIFNLL